MWTPDNRRASDRRGLRYSSDLTDAEWALVAPLIRPAKRGGRPRKVDVREILNANFYLLSTGCQWNALPSDLAAKRPLRPPSSTARASRRPRAAAHDALKSGRSPEDTAMKVFEIRNEAGDLLATVLFIVVFACRALSRRPISASAMSPRRTAFFKRVRQHTNHRAHRTGSP